MAFCCTSFCFESVHCMKASWISWGAYFFHCIISKIVESTVFLVYCWFKKKKSLIIVSLLFCFSQLCFCCRFRHVSDAWVSLHAFFPLVPTKILHCHTADSTCIQTVWSNTWGEQQHRRAHSLAFEQNSPLSAAHFTDYLALLVY